MEQMLYGGLSEASAGRDMDILSCFNEAHIITVRGIPQYLYGEQL